MISENYQNVFNSTTAQEFASIIEKGCTRCSLSKHQCGPIVYRGNPKSEILLIAEAPGREEWRRKRILTGPAGQLLDKIFEVCCNFNTDKDLCLTNCCYCQPLASKGFGKQNYTPKQDQLNICWPFVERFIEIINPKIIIACGRTALMQLTGDNNIRI